MNELYPIIKITTSNKILYDYFVNNSIKFYNNENISVEYMGISRIDTKLMFKIKDVSYVEWRSFKEDRILAERVWQSRRHS